MTHQRDGLEAWQEVKRDPRGIYHVLEPVWIETKQPVGPGWGNYFRVEWNFIGIAESMDDARKRYGGRPVLAWVTPDMPEWVPI